MSLDTLAEKAQIQVQRLVALGHLDSAASAMTITELFNIASALGLHARELRNGVERAITQEEYEQDQSIWEADAISRERAWASLFFLQLFCAVLSISLAVKVGSGNPFTFSMSIGISIIFAIGVLACKWATIDD